MARGFTDLPKNHKTRVSRPVPRPRGGFAAEKLAQAFGVRRRSLRSRRFRLWGTDSDEHRSLKRYPSKAVTSPTPSRISPRRFRDHRGCGKVRQAWQNNQHFRAQCHSSAHTGQFDIAVAGERDWAPGRAGKEKLARQTLSDRQKLV